MTPQENLDYHKVAVARHVRNALRHFAAALKAVKNVEALLGLDLNLLNSVLSTEAVARDGKSLSHAKRAYLLDFVRRVLPDLDEDALLEKYGWVMECASPLEIRHNDTGAFATLEAARLVVAELRRLEDAPISTNEE